MNTLKSQRRFCFALLLYLSSLVTQRLCPNFDINLVGHLKDSSSLSRHTSSFVHCLYPDINFKFFKTAHSSPQGFPAHFQDFIESGFDLTGISLADNRGNSNALTGISIYADSVVMDFWKHYIALPNRSTIKFAYCVTERTLVTPTWITRFNNNFDALLVPDPWLVDVFKNSGLKLPVFVLPEALDLQSLLDRPAKKNPGKPFVFGFSGGCWDRKNHQLMIDAFTQEFGNNPDVILKIHGRYSHGFEGIKTTCKQKNVDNIVLEQKTLTRKEYEDFLASLDCYVTVSKGEGFSIIPREVLALAIPCIVSNNTAQTTICDSGCVYSVRSDILEPSYLIYGNQRSGFHFNSSLDDVKQALRTVYTNYDHYLNLAAQGREWVKQYLPENLKPLYTTLLAPKIVIFGDYNEITQDSITTDSAELFEQYKILYDTGHTTFIRKRFKKEPQPFQKEACPLKKEARAFASKTNVLKNKKR